MLEADVGIVEYASPSVAGIGGVLKRFHTDFIVNEIDCAGSEVVLEPKRADGSNKEVSKGEGDASTTTSLVEEAHQADDDGGSDFDGKEADGEEASWFVRFTLRKERMDTLGAIAMLSKQLEVPVRSFGFAGLKDHRAVTTQEMLTAGVRAGK